MTSQTRPPSAHLVVDARERRQADELLQLLDGHAEHVVVDNSVRTAGVPPELAQLLAKVLEVMARGGTVTIGSLPDELTTTVAAQQLGVSRTTLMKLIQEGRLPAHKVGSHHRVRLTDLQKVKRARLADQRRAYEELVELSERLEDI